jgi:hypothetical protein
LPAAIPNPSRQVLATRLPAGRRPTTALAAPNHQRRKRAAPAARREAIPTSERERLAPLEPLEPEMVARRDAAPAERPARAAAPGLLAVARPRSAQAEPEWRPSLALPAVAPVARVAVPMRVETEADPKFALQAGWVPEAPASSRARQGRLAPERPRSPQRASSTQAPHPQGEAA